MSLRPDQIAIAITVYNRREYLREAVASALAQTTPVRVIVVEDCGPDPGLESAVKAEFGSRIQYVRNPTRRGLFGNWNACLDLCGAEWLSILHDDDFLAPTFVESMLALERRVPGAALYFGRTIIVNERSEPIWNERCEPLVGSTLPPVDWQFRRVGLPDALWITPFPFPGQLFNVAAVRRLGGFRETSFYCGDWEMWAKLIAVQGAAQTSGTIAFNRRHDGLEKGSSLIVRSGRHLPTSCVQHKRVLALLRGQGDWKFDRKAYFGRSPIPTRFLLRYAHSLSPRLLRYHVGLLRFSPPPHFAYAVFQQCARVGGVPFVKWASWIWRRLQPPASTSE
jgi:hypothetical protein